MSAGRAYEIEIRDGGCVVALRVGRGELVGTPAAMRLVRDELTRAIVCAEVLAGADVEVHRCGPPDSEPPPRGPTRS